MPQLTSTNARPSQFGRNCADANCESKAPAANQSCFQSRPFDTCLVRPLCECLCSTVVGNKPCVNSRSPIAGLFFRRCPLAVFRGVIAIIVFSFKRVSRRARPHVCQEVAEAVLTGPAAAHLNPSATVIVVGRSSGVFATIFHFAPRFIGATFVLLACVPVFSLGCFRQFSAKASARFCIAVLQVAFRRAGCVTAIATTQPQVSRPALSLDYFKTSVSFIC